MKFRQLFEESPKKIRESFSIDGSYVTDPISKPKPCIKRHFPKTYAIL
jgi:hypothetical protein